MLNYLEDNRHNLMENKWDGEKWYSIWMRARLGEMKWSTEKGEFI